MLKPAQSYADQIKSKYAERMFDLDYQWYFGFRGSEIPNISDHTYNGHEFASIDKNGNVIGYISYSVNQAANSCYNFGIISFDRGNLIFLRDVKQAIDDIFYKYRFARVEFNCISGNPVLRGYRRFAKKHGGREVGTYQKSTMLLDGCLYDNVLFEILAEDYKI